MIVGGVKSTPPFLLVGNDSPFYFTTIENALLRVCSRHHGSVTHTELLDGMVKGFPDVCCHRWKGFLFFPERKEYLS